MKHLQLHFEQGVGTVTLNRPDAASPFPAVSMDDCAGGAMLEAGLLARRMT